MLTIGDCLSEGRLRAESDAPTLNDFLQMRVTQPLPERWRRNHYRLLEFVEEAWAIIEPRAFTPGWHIEAECQH
jgi:hypothetical protein